MSELKVLVIIVTYNGMQWLERCLDSVVNSSIPLDAYIIDNGSTDGSQEFIQTKYSQFTFYQSPTNSGFGAANNIGLKYSVEHDYDYVYLLNQDAWVDPETISTLIEQQKLNPEYGILSPLQTNAARSMLDRNFAAACAKNRELFSDYVMQHSKKSLYEIDFVMAAHWLIARNCLKTVGLFSPIFYHYGEDDNYIQRAQYHKFKVGIVPSVIGVHDREYRETPKSKDVYMLTPMFLIYASDINRPFAHSAAKSCKNLFLGIVSKMVKYRDNRILCSSLPLIFGLGKISRNRTLNKRIAQW